MSGKFSPEHDPENNEVAWQEYESAYSNWLVHPELNLEEFFPQHEVIEGQPEIEVNSFFQVPELVDKLKEARSKFLFDPSIAELLPLQDYMLQSAKFVEREDWREGRLESQHKVFFGELTLESDGPGQETATIPIACKPFHTWQRGAVHEYSGTKYINNTGIIESFHPVGFWVDDEGMAFLLTFFEEEVVSLDNVDWLRNASDPLAQHLDIFEALKRSAYTLARLHAHGIGLRDAQVKNIAVESKHTIRAIDLEQWRLIQTPDRPNIEAMAGVMLNDGKTLINSIYQAGFLRGDTPETKREVLKTAFLQPYRSTLRHPANMLSANYGSAMHDRYEIVCDELADFSS